MVLNSSHVWDGAGVLQEGDGCSQFAERREIDWTYEEEESSVTLVRLTGYGLSGVNTMDKLLKERALVFQLLS